MNSMIRYLPDKYEVIQGVKSSVALCTCWTDPHKLVRTYPELTKSFSIIGTLYSKEGVSILIRNLCLNPNISHIYVWTDSRLSHTPIGKMGREFLFSVWNNIGSKEQNDLHKELPKHVISTVSKNVSLVSDFSSDIQEVLKQAQKQNLAKNPPYMKPLSFPSPCRDTSEPMPSEEVGWSVRGVSTISAWTETVDRIIRYGRTKKTEYGNTQKELQGISWTIERDSVAKFSVPDWPDTIVKRVGSTKQMLSQYQSIFNSKKQSGSSYTYGSRLMDYDGNVNQIQYCIEKLKQAPFSRRAVAVTFNPQLDEENTNPPCLISVQFLTHGNLLNLFAVFRSQDIFKAGIPNAYGLLSLQKKVAEKTRLQCGVLSIYSVSAHIYEEDWEIATKLLKCAKWESTKLYFDETTDLDPRGLIRISTNKSNINLELVSENGTELFSYSGKSAREVGMKISRLNLLSIPSHYLDVSIELTKAEIAMKKGMKYEQDKPLIFDQIVLK